MTASKETDRLYHYTDAGGLIGIIQSRGIWATDAEFLNDAQELRYGRAELQDALTQRSAEISPSDPSDALSYSAATIMSSAAQALTRSSEALRPHDPGHAAYVSCFCEARDLLSQWRGYGTSGGFAIGFSKRALADIGSIERAAILMDDTSEERNTGPRLLRRLEGVPGEHIPVTLAPVQYGQRAVAAMIAEVLREITPQRPVGHPGVTGYYLSSPA